jgi:UDP-N-acetylglucosamine pyrophosphorylase
MIKWYLMTSEMNNEEVVTFFKEHNYFGYRPDSIFFCPQGGIPGVSYEGKVIIETEGQLALAPGGNGAMYGEMRRKGALEHMRKNGVKYVYVAAVDNVLVKLADPLCVGYMVQHGYEIVSTYVKKLHPDEKIGVHVLKNGKVTVCEYNEIPKALS